MSYDESKSTKFYISEKNQSEMNPEQRISYQLGVTVKKLLFLMLDKDDRVPTAWGAKSALGLGRSIRHSLEECTEGPE